ncbi:MAG: biopolymer transporter Tol [Kiritimatiellaeota bacterium]|nr:biopolymer transporter Tol [Kiritimatiellota bacterium]
MMTDISSGQSGQSIQGWETRGEPWPRIWKTGLALLLAALSAAPAQVRVQKTAGQKSALDCAGFAATSSGAGAEFRRTLQEDLARSGWFVPAAPGRGEYALVGTAGGGGAEVTAQVQFSSAAQRQLLLSKQYRAPVGDARRMAHRVADEILVAIGRKGLFSARIAMIGTRSGSKELYVGDLDGGNLSQITSDRSISVAPHWGPDGNLITYTSYVRRYPDVYLINLASGHRRVLANYPGLNAGGAISPDGQSVALILSKDGSQGLYIRPLHGGAPVRITDAQRAALASPCWAPDGRQIVYVSDQSGTCRPQLYTISRSGGAPRRLTSRGPQNVAPHWGANGLIAYASLMGRFQISVLDPVTLDNKVISSGDGDYEDPSWAPDGRHIVCSRTVNYRSQIYLLDTLGDPPVALTTNPGDWYSPSVTAK